ncbi:MAG: DUF1295 domain-containing protein [Sphaerochaetaceae bacterium]|nr:DUF1295 domain-containing protein [Sphaerochaetaceae bacterium]
MREKQKGLLVITAVYIAAFVIGAIPYFRIDDMLAASALFTAVATVVVFISSCVFSDVSMYDPYWSVEPPVIIALNMVRYRLYGINAWIILCVVGLWAVRLTANWYATYRGIGHEDWRYAMYREKCSPVLFVLLSFFGLHFMPTVVVYASLVSGFFAIRAESFSVLSIPGLVVMLLAVLLELVSDRAMHRFLESHRGEGRTCDLSVWKYSRHPNYLGEMSFWTGMFLYFVPLYPSTAYYGLGFLTVIALFPLVSIPMMEKHNMQRRKDYAEYMRHTSRLLLLPRRH